MPVSTVEVPLSEPQSEYVQKQMENGGYDSPVAVIQNVLEQARLDAAHEAEIDTKILEAINSERPKQAITPAYWEETRARLRERLAQAKGGNSAIKAHE